jgi:phosphotriesterase-related protein
MTTSGRDHPKGYSRRQAIGLLATGAGLTLGAACRGGTNPDVTAGDSATPDAQAVTFPDGAIVRTILDDVAPNSLPDGATLFHEHLQLGFGYYTSPPVIGAGQRRSSAPTEADTERFLDLIVDELHMAATDGMSCVVDAAIGRRSEREIENLRQMASRSGMQVVVAGGYFRAPYPSVLVEMTVDQMADHLAEDAQAQRWGALGEIGTSMEMHPDERRFLRAVSQTHLRTGLPIFSHTDHEGCASCALEQLDIFESEGVDPAHLCIGHLSDITLEEDAESRTHKAIAARGAFVGFDTVGRALGMAPQGAPGKLPPSHEDIPEAVKVRRVLSVLDAGYEDYVLLSADFSSAVDLKANWGNGFSTTLVQFVPKLIHAGVDERTLHKILVDNPRRFLAFVPPPSVV